MFPPEITALAEQVLEAARAKGIKIATAESCTGGLIIGALTEIPGSSDVVERGFITYTNEAKNEMLGVNKDFFDDVGAVSEEVVRAMAEGALRQIPAPGLTVAVSGVAGPGQSERKPVGLVHMALAMSEAETQHHKLELGPLSRAEVRMGTVKQALEALLARLS